MYVLGDQHVEPFPTPFAGRVLRLSESGVQTTPAVGLRFSTYPIQLRPGDGRILGIRIADK